MRKSETDGFGGFLLLTFSALAAGGIAGAMLMLLVDGNEFVRAPRWAWSVWVSATGASTLVGFMLRPFRFGAPFGVIATTAVYLLGAGLSGALSAEPVSSSNVPDFSAVVTAVFLSMKWLVIVVMPILALVGSLAALAGQRIRNQAT